MDDVNQLFPLTCTGSVTLCADDSCFGALQRSVEIVNRFGDVYANIIPASSNVIDHSTSNFLFNENYYGPKRDQQSWSLDVLKRLKQLKKDAENPSNFDPTFIFHFGSRKSLQSTY